MGGPNFDDDFPAVHEVWKKRANLTATEARIRDEEWRARIRRHEAEFYQSLVMPGVNYTPRPGSPFDPHHDSTTRKAQKAATMKHKATMNNTALNAYLITQPDITLVRIGSEYSSTLCKARGAMFVGEHYFFGDNLSHGECLEIDVTPDVDELDALPWVIGSAEALRKTASELSDWETSCRKAIKLAEVKKRGKEIAEQLGIDPNLELPKLTAPDVTPAHNYDDDEIPF